jgi:hypothetical protein
MTTSEPLARLAAELDFIGRRLQVVSQELQHAQAVGPAPSFVQTSMPMPAPFQPPAAMPAPMPPAPMPMPMYVPPPPLPERLGREDAGSKVVAWVGGSVTLLGIVLLMVLAVQRGWLGPEPRVFVGGGLGLALIAGGLWAHRNPAGRSGAYALAATGIAVLYLDIAAATSLYGLMPQWSGLLVALLVAGGGLLLAARWDAQFIAIWVILGSAVCDPVLTHGFTPLLVAFLIVLQIGAMPAQLLRSWPALALVVGIPPVLASLVTTVVSAGPGDHLQMAGVALAATAVGIAVAVVATLRDRENVAMPAILLATAPIAALVAGVTLTRPEAAWLAVIVAALMLGVAVCDRWLGTPITVTAAVLGSIAVVDATLHTLTGPTQAVTLLGESLVLVLAADLVRHRAALLAALLTGGFGLLWGLATVTPAMLVVYRPEQELTVSTALTALLMAGVAITIPLVGYRMEVIGAPIRQAAPWIVAGVVMLYGAAGAVLSTALLIEPDRTGFVFGHAVITVSWTVAAIALLLLGVRSAALRAVGLVLVGAAVVKLILFDLATLDGLARVFAFLAAGLLLLLAGTRYARLVSRVGVITDESRGVTNQVPD